MSAIIEPTSASWVCEGIEVTAVRSDDSGVLLRLSDDASIALRLDQIEDVESLLLNARLWLARAIKQDYELSVADEVGRDLTPEGRATTVFEAFAKLDGRSPA